jgi:hypothetical protein
MNKRLWVRVCGALAVAFTLSATTAEAEPYGGRGGGFDRFDGRYNHNHYYPARGYWAAELPREHFVVNRFNRRFYYSGGIWYAPRGPRFVVVASPIGAFVPVLPPFYTTVWSGGFPYYYANDTYYAWRDGPHAYEVVGPPDDRGATTEAPANDDLFSYPKNGQSEDQQARDQYECHRWASTETGFDPTRSGGGVSAEQNSSKRANYHRAMGACLEGRGYSVK